MLFSLQWKLYVRGRAHWVSFAVAVVVLCPFYFYLFIYLSSDIGGLVIKEEEEEEEQAKKEASYDYHTNPF